MDKEQFIKIFTYIFLCNYILISPIIKENNIPRINLPREHGLPENYNCKEFILGMDEIVNGIDNRLIYLHYNARIILQRIIVIKINDIKSDFNSYIRERKAATQEAKTVIDGLKGQIITIVGLLVSIVPLITTNLSLLNNSASFANILLSNGILILAIGLIFSLINQLVYKKLKCGLFIILGVVLIFLAILIKDTDLIKELFTNLNNLLINKSEYYKSLTKT